MTARERELARVKNRRWDRMSRRATSEDFRFPREATRRSGKEVIQPQVPLRLPCYDFAPVADLTVVGCLLLRGQRTGFG